MTWSWKTSGSNADGRFWTGLALTIHGVALTESGVGGTPGTVGQFLNRVISSMTTLGSKWEPTTTGSEITAVAPGFNGGGPPTPWL